MNVLWVADNFPPSMGGVQQYLSNTVLNMPRLTSSIVTQNASGEAADAIDGRFENAGHRIYRFSDWPRVSDARAVYRSPWPLLKMCLRCVRIIKKETVSLLVIGQISFVLLLLSLFVKLFTRIPVAFIFHGEEIPVTPLRSNGVKRRLIRIADLHICNSSFTETTLNSFCGRLPRAFIANPGVEDKFFDPVDCAYLREKYHLGREKVIYTVGRLDERKGHDLVIEALPALIERVPDILYLIGGTGRQGESLRKKVRELGLERYVRFCGYIPDEDIAAFHRLGDVFVMPNRTLDDGDTEGFGIVFLEANACGKPVIGGASGGAFDAIDQGVTGFLVDPYQTEELCEKIVRLLSDPVLAAEMGESGRQRAWHRFRWPVLAGLLEELLLDTVQAPLADKAW